MASNSPLVLAYHGPLQIATELGSGSCAIYFHYSVNCLATFGEYPFQILIGFQDFFFGFSLSLHLITPKDEASDGSGPIAWVGASENPLVSLSKYFKGWYVAGGRRLTSHDYFDLVRPGGDVATSKST